MNKSREVLIGVLRSTSKKTAQLIVKNEILEEVLDMFVTGELTAEDLQNWYEVWRYSQFEETCGYSPEKLSEKLKLNDLQPRLKELYNKLFLQSLKDLETQYETGIQRKNNVQQHGASKSNGKVLHLRKKKGRSSNS